MTTPARPAGLPDDARWSDKDNEWELGERRNGKSVGVWTWWRPDGKIVCRSTFGEGGKLDGPFQRFHPNGEVCLEGTYQAGRPVGVHVWQFSADKSDQPYFFQHILAVRDKVKKVVVDYQDGRGIFASLADTARFFDAKEVETDAKGVPLADKPAPAPDVAVVPGRDLPRMIARLYGKKNRVPKTEVERDLFVAAMKGVDTTKVRFFDHPTSEYGTWLLDGSDRWDTISYDQWIGCLERLVDPSKDFDGTDGSLFWCGGHFWLPVCGLIGVAYRQDEGGVDAFMVSGLNPEKTATVYSWLTPHTSGGPLDLRFDSPSITHLLCGLTHREHNASEEDDESEATGKPPSVHFVLAEEPAIDPRKHWEARWSRPNFNGAFDPEGLYGRARWILAAVDGTEPRLVKRWMETSEKLRDWEAWRVHPDPQPTTLLYWLLHQYIHGNAAELKEVVAKARRVKGVKILADLVKLLCRKTPVLPGFPLEQARKALRAAGIALGGPREVAPALHNPEAAALLDAFERSPNAFRGPNPWYRRMGSENVRRFAELVDERDRDLVRAKLVKSLKVPENKPGATRGLLLAWGKLAPDFAAFRKAVGSPKLGDERSFELGAAYARFLDDPRARKDLVKLADAWMKDPWKASSEAVWTLLERDTKETRAVIAKLLKTVEFNGPTWETALAAVEAAAKFKIQEAIPGLRRAVEDQLGRTDDPWRARVARTLAEVEGRPAVPFLRERFDAIVAKIRQEKFSYLKRDLPALLSALLRLTPEDPDVLAQARAILTAPFKSLDTDSKTRTHALEAVIQGARGVKALAAEVRAASVNVRI